MVHLVVVGWGLNKAVETPCFLEPSLLIYHALVAQYSSSYLINLSKAQLPHL